MLQRFGSFTITEGRCVGCALRRLGQALLLLLACACWSSPGWAEGRRILLLLGEREPAYLPRLRAELSASGFTPLEARAPSASASVTEIEEAARRERIFVGLAPLEGGGGFELWLIEPASGQVRFRQVLLGLYAAGESPDVVAVRIVEVLRATLMELQGRLPAERVVAPLTPKLPPAPHASRFVLGLGARAAYSPGGLGALALVDLSVGWAATPRLGISLDGALSPARSRLHGSEGSAELAWYWAGLAFNFCLTNPAASLRLRSGAGVWFAYVVSDGQASAPFVDQRSTSLSAVPHVDLGLRLRMTSRLSAAADAAMGFSTPELAVHFAGRELATWGRPLWLAGLGLEVTLD
jgi:hypothetical protein